MERRTVRHLACSSSFRRVFLSINGDFGCTLAPLSLRDRVHNPRDMGTASEPGLLGCDVLAGSV